MKIMHNSLVSACHDLACELAARVLGIPFVFAHPSTKSTFLASFEVGYVTQKQVNGS